MSVVLGNVVVRETGAGLSGAVVAVFAARAGNDVADAVRLGSTLTDDSGRFELEYRVPEDMSDEWDLLAAVCAPDECGTDARESEARLAVCRRRNPSGRESLRIGVTRAVLVEAGLLTVPSEPTPDEIVQRATVIREFRAALEAEDRRVLAESFEASRKLREAADEHFGQFIRALSDSDGGRVGSRYVAPGDSVREASLAAIQHGLDSRINHVGVETVGVFTDQDLATLREQYGAALERVPAGAVEQILWPTPIDRATPMRRLAPHFLCHRQVPINDCVKILDLTVPGPDELPDEGELPQPEIAKDPPPAAPAPPELAPATVNDLAGRLTVTMTSPESQVLFGVRPGLNDVQAGVDGFALRSGPADVPATYDFHRLEIAFESVWQELFDKGALDTGRRLYEKFVELGLDPNKYLIDSTGTPVKKIGKKEVGKTEPNPEPKVTESFEITQREWQALDTQHQERLKGLAAELAKLGNPETLYDSVMLDLPFFASSNLLADLRRIYEEDFEREANKIRAKAARIIKYAKEKLEAPQDFDEFHTLTDELAKTLKEPYRFNVYAAGPRGRSVNFGVVVTYRQKWTPIAYQVGELVRTVPLAPRESRKYTRKVVRKLSRAEKESTSRLESLRTETSVTARVEAEIVARAQVKTNFQVGAEAGFNLGIAKLTGSTSFGQNAEQASQETKKEFRESVFKAASEYKSEHRVEVDVSTSSEFTDEDSGEISNPNDELPVTFLFYELQRRYRVEEQQHKVTPVVLVAQEFPRPDEIDDDWIVAHDWILRRVILDASFIPAMNYLTSKVVGDEHALKEMYANLQQQRRILDKLSEELVVLRSQVQARYEALERSIEQRASAVQEESGEGLREFAHELLFGGDDPDPEAMKAREDAAKDAYQRVLGQEKELSARLDRETSAVAELTDKYTTQLADHLNRRAQISRLRVHIKANIFHYMQAIYSHEPPDQRYFRLRDVEVPRLTGTKTYGVTIDADAVPVPPTWTKPHKLTAHVKIDPKKVKFDRLGDIADLDNLLGFKGNYMMFPLKRENALTDFMMTPYYDPFTGMRDPDQLANWTLHEFAEYVCCLREHSVRGEFERYLPGLIETYRRLKERAYDDSELVVPTGSIYIEALPGTHPILEDYKLAHRATDVKKVQAEVRLAELENLRMVARLLSNEHEDPRVDKKIIIEGAPSVVVEPDNI